MSKQTLEGISAIVREEILFKEEILFIRHILKQHHLSIQIFLTSFLRRILVEKCIILFIVYCGLFYFFNNNMVGYLKMFENLNTICITLRN